ncbi:MAG: DegT/DnrJ/EryC1/StrS family aminotransferase [Planctomycetes bacterium]|nr:DegT/DnrJ/EryC1/StrS family aminotransferase [Planctomycetota bacterium]
MRAAHPHDPNIPSPHHPSQGKGGCTVEELAIKGGPKSVPQGLVKAWPPITDDDKKAVLAVFDSGHLHGTAAPQCVELQKEWAAFVGVKYCLACNSGTAALHMCVAACEIGPGDEVIVPAFTYWSTAAAVLHHNAIPVFADIDPRTFCIDPAKIEEKITSRTKAILPVHIHGMPADMDPVNAIAKKHNLAVIEDACQAHGATYKGTMTGALGTIAGFSTNRSKNLSGGEGGLVTTDDEKCWKIAAKLREFGEVVVKDKDREYNAYGLGWMYRPHEFINAFLRSQLKRLPQHNAKRREMAGYLHEQLAKIPGVKPPYTPPECNPCYFSYVVEFCPQEVGVDMTPGRFKAAAQKALRAEGVGMGQWQQMPVPAQTVFQEKKGYGKGCPWTCRYGRDVQYRGEDYPETVKFIDSHSYLGGVHPPNDMDLMQLYVKAFQKVFSRPKEWLHLADAK